MSETVSFILAISCCIPALAGILRWKQISKDYYSLIILMLAALISELIAGIATIKYSYPQIIPPVYNLYFVADYVLYLVLYKNFQLFNLKTFTALLITGILLLAFDFIFLQTGNSIKVLWKTYPFYAETVLSGIVFFPSIKLLSMQVFQKIPFAVNPKNFIAIGSILLKSYTILNFSLRILDMYNYASVLSYTIFQFINPICYLIFTWAILCIPHKTKYSTS